MSVLLIGCRGSMGKRYTAILNYLEQETFPVDNDHTEEEIFEIAKKVSHIIIATPTETHCDFIKKLAPLKKSILCEKPITKDLQELDETLKIVKKTGTDLKMTFQYSELIPSKPLNNHSIYDYFRTGNDGLVWDCLQIIALSEGEIKLENTSPYWKCTINGHQLKLSDMDGAYVSFIKKWLAGQLTQDLDYLANIHAKTERIHNELSH